ncbi:F1F0 ATP synthase subunit delta [Martiniozyma asiatica (nom. inval.)]|nr:F1F0 ATP synthase subunit delta [Martiniozyma asiatica]
MFRQSLRIVAKSNKLAGVRSYADAANSLKLSVAMPHDTLLSNKEITQVNVPAVSGAMGILANHVPAIEQLKPGLVEIIEGANTTKYFISGGFVSILPDSKVSITTTEAFALESFEPATVKSLLAEAQKNATSADETVAAEASIEVEVLEALEAALH